MNNLYKRFKNYLPVHFEAKEGVVFEFIFKSLCTAIEAELEAMKQEFRQHVENSSGHTQFRNKSEFPRKR